MEMASTRKRHGGESDKDLHQKQFLEAFTVSCSVQKAARWAGVHRQCHYDWLKQDSTYPSRFAEARQRAADMLEDEAVRRAKDGVRRPLVYKGKQVYIQGEPIYQIEYSDQLLIRLLEAYNPETFKRRNETTFQWSGDLSELSESQLATLEKQMLEIAAQGDPAKLVELRKQIEAGAVVIDAVATPVAT
jgi:hypothetical protein